MRAIVWSVLALCAGCAHSGGTAAGVGASLDEAYDAVASGVRHTARSGEYVVDRVAGGTVRVYRSARAGVERGAAQVSDSYLTARVKAALAGDPGTSARQIHVATDGGVVTLRGQVSDRQAATRAIEDALRIDGVVAVDAQIDVFPPSVD